MERIAEVLFKFEEKHPIIAQVIGIGIIYLLGILITLAVIFKVLYK